MSFDFANPPVSRVTSDLSGVAILLWGANGTGKTPIACGMPKPYYLAFESGLTGIDGVPYPGKPGRYDRRQQKQKNIFLYIAQE